MVKNEGTFVFITRILAFWALSPTEYLLTLVYNCSFQGIRLGFTMRSWKNPGLTYTAWHHICPASTCNTTRSVRRSTPSGSYFLVRLAPKAQAKA